MEEVVVDYIEESIELRPYNEPLIDSMPIIVSNEEESELSHSVEVTKNIKTENQVSQTKKKSQEDVPHQRNKRLFGALMGHLDSAKRLLEKDSLKIEKQVQTKSVAAEKHQQHSLKVAELYAKIKETEQKKV